MFSDEIEAAAQDDLLRFMTTDEDPVMEVVRRINSSTNVSTISVNDGQNDQTDPSDNNGLLDEAAVDVVVEEQIIEEAESELNGIPTCNTLDAEVKQYFFNKGLTPKKEIKWRCVDAYETSNEQFYEPANAVLLEIKTPLEYFQSYFNDAFWMETVNFTNLYAVQQDVPHFSPTNLDEMKTFVGVHILMGNLSYPRVRLYWEPKFSIPLN